MACGLRNRSAYGHVSSMLLLQVSCDTYILSKVAANVTRQGGGSETASPDGAAVCLPDGSVALGFIVTLAGTYVSEATIGGTAIKDSGTAQFSVSPGLRWPLLGWACTIPCF